VIELVGDRVRETFDADIVYVALLDSPSLTIDFPYYSEHGNRKPPASISFDDGLTSRVLRTGKPLLIDVVEWRDAFEVRAVDTPPKSYLGVPISRREAIGWQSRRGRRILTPTSIADHRRRSAWPSERRAPQREGCPWRRATSSRRARHAPNGLRATGQRSRTDRRGRR
jgi:hypothetical protein